MKKPRNAMLRILLNSNINNINTKSEDVSTKEVVDWHSMSNKALSKMKPICKTLCLPLKK